MTFPKYPEYKDSGVEWLGEVPAHWDLAPPKRYVATAPGGTLIKGQCASEPKEGLYPGYSASGQDVWIPDFQYDREGLVLSAVGARCGKTFVASGKWGVVANTQCLLPYSTADNKFLWYVANLDNWWERGGSAQPYVLVESTLSRIWAFPPKNEQELIAAFLGHETARIDALVEEQQRLIELLKEKRQAVISHAVTKGLAPDVPMKDSGVEWLGEVPANWAVVALRRALQRIEQGWSPECYSFPADEGSWGVLKAGAVNNGVYRENDNKALPEGVEPRHSIEVMPGDLLMCRASGSPELIGSAAYVESTRPMLMISDKLFRLVTNEEVCPEFIALSLGSIPLRRQIEISINGAEGLANNLSQASIKNLKLTLPPISEQRRIVSEIAAVLNSLKEQLDLAVDTVELLQERRSALISAAVTGKIDVRGWQPPAGASSPSEATQTEMV